MGSREAAKVKAAEARINPFQSFTDCHEVLLLGPVYTGQYSAEAENVYCTELLDATRASDRLFTMAVRSDYDWGWNMEWHGILEPSM